MATRVLFWDVETHESGLLWDMLPAEFFRLGGYAWGGDGEVVLTEDLDEMVWQIKAADLVVGHNIHAFDLTAVFGKDSLEPLRMARAKRVFDTWTHATLVKPPPTVYTNREGKTRYARKPAESTKWFALDNLAYQLGVAGKSHDLKALAKEFGGFGQIPVDDERFREYLTQDVNAVRDVARKLWKIGPPNGYAWREQLNAAIDAQNSRNGWRLDVDRARARVAELEALKERYLALLADKYGMPTDGKAPLRTKAGKAAVIEALEAVGISVDDLPSTKTGNTSLGGEGIIDAASTKSAEAQELAEALATIGGLRPLAQSAIDCLSTDGRVHPSITTLQRSGRKSTTEPGLTVWTSRGKGAVEKSYFIPNHDDDVLVEFDYSQADARIVAAYSGDRDFAKRFEPGADAHMITARAVWRDEVDNDPAGYRQKAKKLSHAYAYRAGPRTLARTSGQPISVAKKFVEAMQKAYPKVTHWQDRATREGRSGRVTNAWGRCMVVEKDREWTQAPALLGQSGTREIGVDALIRMPDEILTMLVAQVHDAFVFSIPRDRADEIVTTIKACMECYWQPPNGTGQKIYFPVGNGPYALNWYEAGH